MTTKNFVGGPLTVRCSLQPAHFSEVLRFSAAAHERSNYSAFKFNSVIARNTLRACSMDGSMRIFTAWRDTCCVGILIGMIASMPWTAGMSATDLVFVADQGGDQLLERFVKWARDNKVVRVDMAVSDDAVRAGYDRFFKREGFNKAGGVYFAQWPQGDAK